MYTRRSGYPYATPDAMKEGCTKLLIRTVDTDVVVLAVTLAHLLAIPEMWVAFGAGKYFRCLPAHEIAKTLGPQRCEGLPMFHAFTGCDSVSFFGGRGKRTAWNVWQSFDEVTQAFISLTMTPETIHALMPELERFVILLYDITSTKEKVNEGRKELFTQKGRAMEGLPPTEAALTQHTKRAAYQAGHIWGQMAISAPEIPSPKDWGLKWNPGSQTWEAVWTTLPEATKACRELQCCSCKPEKGCRGHCKCMDAALTCTVLCKCQGQCQYNNDYSA